jgi:hypothetical protein
MLSEGLDQVHMQQQQGEDEDGQGGLHSEGGGTNGSSGSLPTHPASPNRSDPAPSSVETQVAAFVASVLEPLLRAGVVSAALAERVVGKALEKIMARHEGCTDCSFLVREYTSITKLVTALVDHYQKRQ